MDGVGVPTVQVGGEEAGREGGREGEVLALFVFGGILGEGREGGREGWIGGSERLAWNEKARGKCDSPLP